MADSEITLEYLCDNVWLVGSPETVARKIRDLHQQVGGFGGLLIGATDWQDSTVWDRSITLFAQQVVPLLADLATPAPAVSRG
jgi:3,6-diketocamphane 1,6-monooxygenase